MSEANWPMTKGIHNRGPVKGKQLKSMQSQQNQFEERSPDERN